MKRIEILKEARKLLIRSEFKGICSAIKYVLLDIDAEIINPDIIFPELKNSLNAEKYRKKVDCNYRDYWWVPGNFRLFSGRRRFMRWLMWKYRNDKEEIKIYEKD